MTETATFGAGCFWGVEAAFREVSGVLSTSVGYMGGHFENPCYLDVLSRITGHAEVCQVEFDPNQVSYAELVDRFWQIHDPTSLNRQGADRDEQYQSVIFYHTEAQEAISARRNSAGTAIRSKAAIAASGRYDEADTQSVSRRQRHRDCSSFYVLARRRRASAVC